MTNRIGRAATARECEARGARAMAWAHRTGLPVVLTFCLVLASCQREPEPVKPAAPPPKAAPAAPQLPVHQRPGVADVAPAAMRAAVADAYRLGPDRRALLAVADLHHLLAGSEPKPVGFKFSGAEWRIYYGFDEIGRVPEFPGYADLRKLMADLAVRLRAQKPVPTPTVASNLREIERGVRSFVASEALRAARLASEAWQAGERDPEVLRLAAQGLVALCLQSFDRLEIADALPARALALAEMYAAAGGAELAREHALLAGLLGYEQEARGLAEKLPVGDPARAFLQGDEASLRRLAQAPNATPEARYLLLSHLARRRQLVPALEFQSRHFAGIAGELSWFRTILEARNFAVTEGVALALPYAILIALAPNAPEKPLLPMLATGPQTPKQNAALKLGIDKLRERHGIAEDDLVVPFEKALEATARESSGTLFDAELLRAFYRGYFYSALERLGRHYLDSLSSLPAAAGFAASLRTVPEGPGSEFKRWYTNRSQVKAGAATAGVLLADLNGIKALGGSAVESTFELFASSEPSGSARMFSAARQLAARLDSRPGHRYALGGIAYTSLMDVALAERLYGSAAAAAPHAYTAARAWLALVNENREEVSRLIASPEGDVDERFATLDFLAKSPQTDPQALAAAFEELIARRPESWRLRRGLVELLEKTGDYAKARGVVLDWLKRGKPSDVFDEIFARTALARIFGHEGRHAEALNAVMPAVASGQAGAMEQAALLLARAGRREDAEKLSAEAVVRYPNILRTLLTRARLLWMDARYDEAAALFKAHRNPISAFDWRFTVAKALLETFDRAQGGSARAAFMAMHRAKIDAFSLLELASAAAAAERVQLAFEMASVLRHQGLGQLEMTVTAYDALKRWKGEAAALSWIREQVPPPLLNPLSMFAFRGNAPELLWGLIGPDPSGQGADFVWLMRAASAVRQGLAKDPNRAALEKYFRSAKGSHYEQIGRYLLGMLSEDELLALAVSPKARCEIAFYAGLRAEAERRLQDASAWYRVAVETGLSSNGEWRWAYDQLYRWYSSGKSLAVLEKAGT